MAAILASSESTCVADKLHTVRILGVWQDLPG